MRNFYVSVFGDVNVNVVVGDVIQATGLASQNVIKGRGVTIEPTQDRTTHRNTYQAQAYIDVQFMELDGPKQEISCQA